jgi:hypothetical protein
MQATKRIIRNAFNVRQVLKVDLETMPALNARQELNLTKLEPLSNQLVKISTARQDNLLSLQVVPFHKILDV